MNTYDISDFPQILLIDTNDPTVTRVGLVTSKSIIFKELESRAQEVLTLIESVISEAGIELRLIKLVGVLDREGSLTGQRIGIAAANTLAWTLGVPMLISDKPNLKDFAEDLKKGEKFEITKVVHAN